MNNAIMVDIETMGTSPTAAILAIGACRFDPSAKDDESALRAKTFDVRISLKSNTKLGRTMDPDTVTWWLTQSKEAQKGLYEGEITNLTMALQQFRKWIEAPQTPRPTRLWAKDPDFDVVILNNAYQSIRERLPFHYADSRSVRTITDVAYPDGDPPLITVGEAHKASDDAIKQALMVQHCWCKLRGCG